MATTPEEMAGSELSDQRQLISTQWALWRKGTRMGFQVSLGDQDRFPRRDNARTVFRLDQNATLFNSVLWGNSQKSLRACFLIN